MRHLCFGSGVCDHLFIRVPLMAVAAELQIEAGHKRVKHAATLSQQAYNTRHKLSTQSHITLFYFISGN